MNPKDKETGPTMQPEDLAHLDEWTPEQQVMALKYRAKVGFEQSPLNFSFTPRPSDVIIAVPGKSGTTWVSHICHQLRMRGAEPDFDDQDKLVVWMEKGVDWYGLDPNTTPQPAEPRLFKSHLPYGDIPAGGKMIYCFRDLKDVVVSFYHFQNTMLALRGRVSLPIFAQSRIQVIAKALENLLAWWDHRHDDNVLFLFFDDLKEDHPGCVRRIAKFMDIECSEEILKRVVHSTTHAEMSRHSNKFTPLAIIESRVKKFGEKPLSEIIGKVRTNGGRSGDGQALPVEVQQYIEEKWAEIVTAKLGFKTLKEMRAAWHKELMS